MRSCYLSKERSAHNQRSRRSLRNYVFSPPSHRSFPWEHLALLSPLEKGASTSDFGGKIISHTRKRTRPFQRTLSRFHLAAHFSMHLSLPNTAATTFSFFLLLSFFVWPLSRTLSFQPGHAVCGGGCGLIIRKRRNSISTFLRNVRRRRSKGRIFFLLPSQGKVESSLGSISRAFPL